MFELWFELPPALRACFGLLLIGIAALIFFATGGTRGAIGLFAVGLVFLLFAGAGSNSNGYKF